MSRVDLGEGRARRAAGKPGHMAAAGWAAKGLKKMPHRGNRDSAMAGVWARLRGLVHCGEDRFSLAGASEGLDPLSVPEGKCWLSPPPSLGMGRKALGMSPPCGGSTGHPAAD